MMNQTLAQPPKRHHDCLGAKPQVTKRGQALMGFEEGSVWVLNNCQCTMKSKDLWHPA